MHRRTPQEVFFPLVCSRLVELTLVAHPARGPHTSLHVAYANNQEEKSVCQGCEAGRQSSSGNCLLFSLINMGRSYPKSLKFERKQSLEMFSLA